jgi:aspartokinase-like uncharacterized kinase
MSTIVRVVKVGGSLFSFEELPDRGQAWLAQQPPGITVFIGGGGDLVEPLRAVHERFSLDQEASHWLAVRAMTVTSRLLAKLLNVELVERFEVVEQLIREGRHSACVLDCEEFLRARESQSPGSRLAHDWTCTSDSIAARIAEVLCADELVMLKSVPLPTDGGLAEAARRGLVDEHFPQAVTVLKEVRWVNLRE